MYRLETQNRPQGNRITVSSDGGGICQLVYDPKTPECSIYFPGGDGRKVAGDLQQLGLNENFRQAVGPAGERTIYRAFNLMIGRTTDFLTFYEEAVAVRSGSVGELDVKAAEQLPTTLDYASNIAADEIQHAKDASGENQRRFMARLHEMLTPSARLETRGAYMPFDGAEHEWFSEMQNSLRPDLKKVWGLY